MIDGRDAATLDEAAARLEPLLAPGRPSAPCRVTSPTRSTAGHWSPRPAPLGGLDLLVNNAGTLGASPLPSLADYPLDVLRVALEVNVVAPLGVTQAALPLLLASPRPRLLNVTSDAGVEAYEGWGGYGAGKAALEQLGAVLAVEHPGAHGLVGRPRGSADADAPGRLPRRGHLRPARAGIGGARLPRADPERSTRAVATGPAEVARRRDGAVSAVTATAPLAGTRPALPRLHPLRFTLPPELEAPSPPESRGMTRDAVRMLVAHKGDGSLVHTHFSELPRFLDEGDLVVLNTSGTLAAEVDGIADDGRACRSISPPSCPPGCGRWRCDGTARPSSAPTPDRALRSPVVAGVRLLAPVLRPGRRGSVCVCGSP